MRLALKFIEGGLAGQTREVELLDKKHVSVGRDPTCTIPLPDTDRTASSLHAKFVLEKTEVVINDIGSHYGLYINGKAMPRARLKGGEQIRFGAKGPLAELLLGQAAFGAGTKGPAVTPSPAAAAAAAPN